MATSFKLHFYSLKPVAPKAVVTKTLPGPELFTAKIYSLKPVAPKVLVSNIMNYFDFEIRKKMMLQ